MKKINLVITGCMGRMGQQLIKSIKTDRATKLVGLTENILIKKKIGGIKPQLNNYNVFKKTDVIIDFTMPKCTFEVLKIASKLKKRVVIGTTGFTKSEEDEIKKISKKSFEISARILVDDFEKRLEVNLNLDEKNEIDTLGGFIFFLLGRIPGRGEVINYKNKLEFTIIEADTRRIKRVLVTLK